MKHSVAFHLVLALVLVLVRPGLAEQETPSWQLPQALDQLEKARAALIPFPKECRWENANYTLPAEITIRVSTTHADHLRTAAVALEELLGGLKLSVKRAPADQAAPADITLSIDPAAAPRTEGYTLSVSPKGISIAGVDAAGAFYAVQTLRQLLQNTEGKTIAPCCNIKDWPAFAVRGFMHDVGRNFQTIEELKPQLDIFAAYKLNTFHWHLTDNPAWRVESRAFPQLNDPNFHQPDRDVGKFYTYDQIRNLIAYARARNIRVLPELDMPGHSAYFNRTFGFAMGTPQGIEVLEKLIEEFCREIPVADCPMLHIGSDEVRIKDPNGFMERIGRKVREMDRKAVVWNPGLKPSPEMIEQLWHEDGAAKAEQHKNAFLDSSGGYLNNLNPMAAAQNYFFQQPCRQATGNERALGGILCLWPDVRVADKRNIFRHSPAWSGLLTFSEAIWCGRPQHCKDYMIALPPPGSDAWKAFADFENRLAIHRDRFFAGKPFPYVRHAHISWRVAGPFWHAPPADAPLEVERAVQDTYASASGPISWRNMQGGILTFWAPKNGPDKNAIPTMYALTYLHSESARTICAWTGFETPARSNRMCGGVPPAGKWDSNGGELWLNDVAVTAPTWKLAGQRKYATPTWFSPANEIPYDDEEFYWTREPARLNLKAGWNKLLVRVPRATPNQKWTFCFAPVREQGGAWIEDMSVKFSARPE